MSEGARYIATASAFREFKDKFVHACPFELVLVSCFFDEKSLFREENPMAVAVSFLCDTVIDRRAICKSRRSTRKSLVSTLWCVLWCGRFWWSCRVELCWRSTTSSVANVALFSISSRTWKAFGSSSMQIFRNILSYSYNILQYLTISYKITSGLSPFTTPVTPLIGSMYRIHQANAPIVVRHFGRLIELLRYLQQNYRRGTISNIKQCFFLLIDFVKFLTLPPSSWLSSNCEVRAVADSRRSRSDREHVWTSVRCRFVFACIQSSSSGDWRVQEFCLFFILMKYFALLS